MRHAAILLMVCAASPAAAAEADTAAATCSLADVRDADRLNSVLAARAIDALERAARPGWRGDAELAALVAGDAAMFVGRGDVGDQLDKGAAGLRIVALKLASAHYRIPHLEGIPAPPLSGCDRRTVTIEFARDDQALMTSVRFIFENGAIEKMDAEEVGYVSGVVAAAK